MPSSRKRNKGKERKAKKVQSQRANVREIWWGFTTRKNITTQTDCDHGYTLIPNDFDHPVSKYLDEFYLQICDKDDGIRVLRSTFDTHPQIWNDANNRDMLLNVLVRIGTNMLLLEHNASLWESYPTNWLQPSRVVEMILTFHVYGETMNINSAFLSQNVIAKTRDLAPDMSSFKRQA